MKKNIMITILCILSSWFLHAQEIMISPKGVNEYTPSKSIYFDWINRNWYGSNEGKVEANLQFFKWLHDQYGMKLDIYLMDAADIDQGPNCNSAISLPAYGSINSPAFKERYPSGLSPLTDLAKSFDCQLGIWLGPDGYGTTMSEAEARKEMLISFCKDYNFALFKFDACCSDLSAENQNYFIETMKDCRKYNPDLIVLNHRINFNEEALKQTTTFLWEGKETYVDVNIWNTQPAPHHREGNLARGLPPDLLRLTEDHGVCLSSALDAWEDDLILQAFSRNLILSPEIYGNPFLLPDADYPKLARIYNLHRRYNNILVKGMQLPSEIYGENAVSRGNDSIRLITLRNLSWQPIHINIKLDTSIGITSTGDLEVFQYHPSERFLGIHKAGSEVEITVLPFRASLIKVSAIKDESFFLEGIDYEIVREVAEKPIVIKLLGNAGETVKFNTNSSRNDFRSASINGADCSELLNGEQIDYKFPGKKQSVIPIKKTGLLLPSKLPPDVEKIIETNLFSIDNNALEVRELIKSGQTKIKQVEECRNQFFNDSIFISQGAWDKFAFDGESASKFKVRLYEYRNIRKNDGLFRLDINEPISLDSLVFYGIQEGFNPISVEVSMNLDSWEKIESTSQNNDLFLKFDGGKTFRYLRMNPSPVSISEIKAYSAPDTLDRNKWRASNLFGLYEDSICLAWNFKGKISGASAGSYLCVTLPGNWNEGTSFAGMKLNGKWIGANDRAPSFPYNNWEHFRAGKSNFTYFIPLSESMNNEKIEVVLLGTDPEMKNIVPEVWQIGETHSAEAELVLER